MSRETDIDFEVRSGDGVTVIEAGQRTKEGEILPNRRNAERLFERRPGMAGFEEIGAHAEGAVATERPNLKAEDLNLAMENMSQCACGRMVEGAVCGCADGLQNTPNEAERNIDAAVKRLEPAVEALKAQWRTPSARQLPLDTYNAPGEHGHYSRLHPQPVDVIEAWGLNHHEAEALAHLARWRYDDHPKEDLEKAVWWIRRLIDLEYGEKSL